MDITQLLAFSVKNKASDLHLSAGLPPMIRVHGDVRRINVDPLDHKQVHAMVYDIMNDTQRKHYEEFLEIDFSFEIDGLARFRVNAFNHQRGAGAVFRTIPSKILSLEQLNAPKIFADLALKPRGLVLVTGPTGSGKTTTLYSTLKRVATEEVNVSTVEDPIEMIEPAFNQTQVQPQLDFGFPEGLRALMRQDPDIIMVGEIRDLETAEMAVQAALTGHLVFSTLHTNDAPSAITRLMELGIPAYLINATVLGVLAQRLVRTLCQQCKVRDETATREALAEVVKPWQISGGYKPYKPVGCVDCRMTGFMGRMGLYELLVVSEAFKEKVNREPNMDALRRQAIQDGMRPLRLAGALRVAEGLTVMDEVLSATPPLV